MCIAEGVSDFDGYVGGMEDAVAFGIGEVVSEVCDGVGDAYDLCFEGHSAYGISGDKFAFGFGVAFDGFDHVVRQV